ncbi:hypothetical protein ACQEVI_05820 [Promicromonospora sp. CA-289599]|uniref:hypothetical protein n=1 Tax=Promicromonospora sp. CA-289599 TaxID=3240014 RepID=UPI003D8E42D1
MMTKNEATAIAYDERYNSTRTLLWNLSESAPPASQDAYWDLCMQFDSAHTLDAADLDEIQMIDTRDGRTVYDGVAEALDWMLTVTADYEARAAILVVVGIEINVFTLQWARARLDELWRAKTGLGEWPTDVHDDFEDDESGWYTALDGSRQAE